MFSELLKELRSKKGVSQKQLADAIGVSTGNVGDWETGKSKPGYVAIAELTRFFEVSAEYLLEMDTANSSNIKAPRFQVYCDGVPLTEDEADLVAMYRLISEADRGTIFDLTKLKYEQSIGKKESTYSAYTDAKQKQKSDSSKGGSSTQGIA